MREEIIKAANRLIYLLMECDDEHLVGIVTSEVMYAEPFSEESEGADDE